MVRRVVETKATTLDREELRIVTIFEQSIKKEEIKRMSGYSKAHEVLIQRDDVWEFKGE